MIMHPAIKLRHIRVFLEIAAAGNLTAVARAQGITQPALSRTLAELEDLLATPLFRREGRRLVLTDAGHLFRHHATQGVQAFEAAAAALRPSQGGVITVGVLPTAATRLFPQVALRAHELMPDARLSVITGPHSYLMRLLREGGIDLMVGRMPASAEIAALSFEHLYEEDVVMVVRADHPLRTRPVAEVLGDCPLILPPEGAIIRRAVEDYFASLGLGTARPAFETVALAVGRGIVLGSDAVWFISRGVVQEDLDRGEMALIPTQARMLSGVVGLTRRQDPSARPGIEALVQITRDCVRLGLHR